MNRLVPLFLLIIPLVFGSCSDADKNDKNRIGKLAEADIEYVYFDYRVSAEEGDDNLTIMLQFRDGGHNGPSLIADVAGKVELDGERIKVDSSGLTGAFYEMQKPLRSFSGDHRIVFSYGEKKYSEEFRFEPMAFKTELPDTLNREDLIMEMRGLEPEDYVRILMFDTTAGDGVNRLDTVRNGLIRLESTDFDKLSTGDIHLELHREFEKPVENGTREGGRIAISYVLKRRLFLRD